MDYKSKYTYKPYDKNFPEFYKNEKLRLESFLQNIPHRIEHFGSTAIPDVGGKGIIDIYVVTEKPLLQTVSQKLALAEYEFRESGGNADRLFHHRITYNGNEQQIYHVHVTYFGNDDFERELAFRDFLIANPDWAKKYSDIKQKASEEALKYDDKDKMKEMYMQTKLPVIEDILGRVEIYRKKIRINDFLMN